MKNSYLLFLIILIFSSFITGDLTISVQSENSRDIEIVALNQTSYGNLTEGSNLEVPYNNYIVKMTSNTSKTVTSSNLFGFIKGINNKMVYFIIIAIIVFMIIYFMRSA